MKTLQNPFRTKRLAVSASKQPLTVAYDELGRRIVAGIDKVSEVKGPQWTKLATIQGTPAAYMPWDCLKKKGENNGI